MYCPICKDKVKMVLGIAIKDLDGRCIMDLGYIKFEDLKIIEVLKCPKCGYSESIGRYVEDCDIVSDSKKFM